MQAKRLAEIIPSWVMTIIAVAGLVWYLNGKLTSIEASVANLEGTVNRLRSDYREDVRAFDHRLVSIEHRVSEVTISLAKLEVRTENLERSVSKMDARMEIKPPAR